MDYTAIHVAALMLAGLAIVVMEAFVPSFGLLTLSSLACQAAAVYLAFSYSDFAGWVTLVAALVLTPTVLLLALNYFPNLPIGKWFILRQTKSQRSERIGTSSDYSSYVDAEGVAITALRPSGIGKFDGKRISVVTRGEMVEKGKRIKVVKAAANRIVVKEC